MKFMELMQRAGLQSFGIAKSYFKSALLEVESRYPDKIEQAKTNLTKDKRYYSTPPNMVNLQDVRVKYKGDDGETKYRSIPRIKMVEDIDQDGV
tara:strand:- start:14775 stop:15056 length:282 start_codon:yes stop_codon:yes gene_type:complete